LQHARSSSPFAQRIAFNTYLRMGVQIDPTEIDALQTERKFNPNHDPTNGQFTFGPGGSSVSRPRATSWSQNRVADNTARSAQRPTLRRPADAQKPTADPRYPEPHPDAPFKRHAEEPSNRGNLARSLNTISTQTHSRRDIRFLGADFTVQRGNGTDLLLTNKRVSLVIRGRLVRQPGKQEIRIEDIRTSVAFGDAKIESSPRVITIRAHADGTMSYHLDRPLRTSGVAAIPIRDRQAGWYKIEKDD
jgi:hypothetical protein